MKFWIYIMTWFMQTVYHLIAGSTAKKQGDFGIFTACVTKNGSLRFEHPVHSFTKSTPLSHSFENAFAVDFGIKWSMAFKKGLTVTFSSAVGWTATTHTVRALHRSTVSSRHRTGSWWPRRLTRCASLSSRTRVGWPPMRPWATTAPWPEGRGTKRSKSP